MKMFVDVTDIYLHKAPVDFRKGINGLSLIVEQHMNLNPFSEALFVFCNRTRDKLKVLYWQRNGFCLWQKRLEDLGHERCTEPPCHSHKSSGNGYSTDSTSKK